jgi:hypothetical protein
LNGFDLLNEAECDQVHRQLHEVREHWTPRGPLPLPYFTMGASGYLDPAPRYNELALQKNPVLDGQFAWLYERLLDFFRERLEGPVAYDERVALPGFHIWRAPNIFCDERPNNLAPAHFDLQYMEVWNWTSKVDLGETLSFTLPIRLPRRGGGLNVWALSYQRYLSIYIAAGGGFKPDDLRHLEAPTFHQYAPGQLVVHDGHVMHQVAAVDAVFAEDERITLQGHAAQVDGVWKLYW